MEMKDRIIQVMKIKSLNASELADLMEIKRPSLSHIMTGRNNPSLDFITRLKETFPEISLDWLLFGKGSMTVSTEPKPVTAQKTLQPKLFGDDEETLESRPMHGEHSVQQESVSSAPSEIEEKQFSQSDLFHQKETTKKEVSAPDEQRPTLTHGQKRPVKMLIIYDDDTFMQFSYQQN